MKGTSATQPYQVIARVLAVVGLLGLLAYHGYWAHHPAVIAMSWAFLVYGGVLEHRADLARQIRQLEEKVESLSAGKT